MSVAAVLTAAALTWFGPVPISFDASLPGDPYDIQANDVRVSFVAADGHREERLAYFDDGHWKAWLATTHPAAYEARLTRNGQPVDTAPLSVAIADTACLSAGYVQVRDGRFVSDAGHPYFPLGHNLGWQQPDSPTLLQQLQDMGRAGMNWTRIWACAFDEKNPFYSRITPPPPPGDLLPAPLHQWDELVATGAAAGVRLQLVLFHHGLFSSEVNSNWDEHAWNAANGGFLAQPRDFFIDPTARDYTKRWLRHAVARWGHSPSIMAWELFNEVEWVDTVRQDHDWATVAAWHADMAAFIRSIDPYHHLVTTSSAMEHPGLYETLDYYQPHIYTRNLTVGIGGTPLPTDKPLFYGEFGGNAFGATAPDERLILRDGLWASVLAGQAGAAGYWYWERVAQKNLAGEFTHVGRALSLSGLPERTAARPLTVTVTGARPAPLQVAPGRGWAPTAQHEFNLPVDSSPNQLALWSSYVRAPEPETPDEPVPPLVFHFTAPVDGQVTINLANASPRGARLVVQLDGREVAAPSWLPTPRSTGGPASRRRDLPPIEVTYPAGPHTLTLNATGPDWVQLANLAFSDLGSTTQAMAIGDADFVLARIQSTADGVPARLDLQFPGLADGPRTLYEINLDNGEETHRDVTIADGTLRDWIAEAGDVVLILVR